jgi:AraC-like DNA-binding protein
MELKTLLNQKRKIITMSLLVVIVVSSAVALFMLPDKVFFSVLLVISVSGLIVYYLFSGNRQTSQEVGRKKYSDILIIEELDRFFTHKKPYLNATYKISDLEKQLRVSRSAISLFTKERYGISFNQFLNLWRIAETKRLQSLPENEDISINKLCVKAGFSNAQQYHQAEKERKARKMKKGKSKLITKKDEGDKFNDLDIIKKPEIQMRV